MPRIEIWDVRSTAYIIDSSDRELISRWLGEIVARLGPEAASYNMPLRIQFYPRFDSDGEPDWCTHSPTISNRYELNKTGLQALLDDLRNAGIDVPETTGATA